MNEWSLRCKRQRRREWQLDRPLEICPQIPVDAKAFGADQLFRIEKIFRIEGALDCAHHLEQLGSDLIPQEFSARNPHPVLRGERALALPDERGDFIRHAVDISSGRPRYADRGQAGHATTRPRRGRSSKPPVRAVA